MHNFAKFVKSLINNIMKQTSKGVFEMEIPVNTVKVRFDTTLSPERATVLFPGKSPVIFEYPDGIKVSDIERLTKLVEESCL